MKTFIYIFFFLSPSFLFAHDYSIGNLIIDHPILEKNEKNAKGFLMITNNGYEDIYLLDGRSFFSNETELHRTSNINKYEMYLVDKIEIPAHSSVSFKDLNYHIMFYNYDKKLKWFEDHGAMLKFSNNQQIEIKFDLNE